MTKLVILLFMLLACSSLLNQSVLAQTGVVNAVDWSAEMVGPTTTGLGAPPAKWQDLSSAHQSILAPLEDQWATLDPLRKRKWLNIAQRYPQLNPEAQQRVMARMKDWANLTPVQRRQIRENYALARSAINVPKGEKWEKYQQLPEEKKRWLAEKRERRALNQNARPAGQMAGDANLPAGSGLPMTGKGYEPTTTNAVWPVNRFVPNTPTTTIFIGPKRINQASEAK